MSFIAYFFAVLVHADLIFNAECSHLANTIEINQIMIIINNYVL